VWPVACAIASSPLASLSRRPLYVALFSSSVDTSSPYQPFVLEPDDHPVTAPHGLDREVAPALPALWYFLHLPRTFAEVVDLPLQALLTLASIRPEHCTALVPVEAFDTDVFPVWPPTGRLAVLMVAPEDLMPEAARLCEEFQFLMPPISARDLSDETLQSHWADIHQKTMSSTQFVAGALPLSRRLDCATIELPVRRMARQLRRAIDVLPPAADDPLRWLEERLTQEALIHTLAQLETEQASPDAAERLLSDRLNEEMHQVRIPVALAAPGVASPYRRTGLGLIPASRPLQAFDKRDTFQLDMELRPDELVERAAIEFLATHGGVQDGFALMLPTISPELFAAFASIEEHWSRGPKPGKVQRLMTRLDLLAAPLWTDLVIRAVQRASILTVFSNFPLGVLRVPGDTAPLSCRVPVAYRPLVPLTRAIQIEGMARTADLSSGFRVLVAECIPSEDIVGRLSRRGWDVGAAMFESDAGQGSTLVRAETESVADLRAVLADVNPDVLVLSAHGASDGRVAGVVVGDELCLGPEIGPVPPVVVLSACHSGARGRGQLNVADFLLREGAVAVLAPHVPVDVQRNALLTMRLFVYMTLSVSGEEPHATLVDAWQRAQSTNALLDILRGNRRLEEWGGMLTRRGTPVITEFMNAASVGRLRPNHVYVDTERVLIEMAEEMGTADEVAMWLRAPGYVPESAFYAFIGRPERVLLQRPPAPLPAS
jgi:hypothetical protein